MAGHGSLDSAYLVENTGTFNNTGLFYNRCTASFLNDSGTLTGNALEYAFCNNSPVAERDSFTLNEDGGATFDLLTNDSDADDNLDPASTEALQLPDHGNINNNFDGTYDYLPDLNFFGPDSFTYQICDTGSDEDATTDDDDLCAEAIVDLTIRAVNDTPSFVEGANQVIGLNAGPQLIPGWASGMSPGPVNEAGQLLAFYAESDNPDLFTFQPAVFENGDLAYIPVTAGLQSLDFAVPASAENGPTYARFRINSAGGLAPDGYASDGEVEDYPVNIEDRPDAIFANGFEDNP